MNTELKKCPFCGGEATLAKGLCELDNYVMCLECISKTRPYNTKESAIKAWNTRKPMDEIVEQLEEQKIPNWSASKTEKILRKRNFEDAIEIVKGGAE